ncbi:Spindle pole body component alp14 [Tolypocladium capitatum]|uniref:Spindle pole body component alp14 n=1 Tax=Tolypocladium capitatum TaxID=45235 RepID=A0A2K3QBZ9_9HYPO|nr:Spindle pole body component alp14 [Tolypocladium capitatum]
MADKEEDFSSLPLPDRFTHKLWKVRKEAYEEAAKQFSASPDESDPCFRPFVNESGLWKSAVADSNVAAQQEGIIALCAFLKFGGRDGALRTRGVTVSSMVEKSLSSTRAAIKQNALEAILLYIELDVAAPVLEDVITGLSNKVPKNVAATLSALTAIFHNYGCKIVDPKPVLKALPKVFGAADKNVRAEATNLTVELYRWLREAMKPMFWGELKPSQQTDLEAQFEKVKADPPPKQERLLRSQQAAAAAAPAGGAEGDEAEGYEEPEEVAEVDAFSLAEPVDISKKIPPNFSDMLASSKWKDRKEAVDALAQVLNVPRIKDSDFNEVTRGLAKCMKDANVAVVTQAAQCIELLAKGMRHGFGKHRAVVMQPIMDRLKEKKATVADALGTALDAVFGSTNLTDCLEDILAYLGNKNPQVKEGTMKFLIRCLRTTRDVPSKPEIASICESGKKLLSESSPALRDGGAEILGTVMKIIGERAMLPNLEGLDDIRKNKVKEFFETADVRAKEKPKPAPVARAPPAAAKKMVGGKRPAAKKAAPAAAAPRAPESIPSSPQPTPKHAAPGSKLGIPKSSGNAGLKAPQKRTLAAPGTASPRRALGGPPVMPADDEPAAPPQPRLGLSRGLAGRSLAKPAAAPAQFPPDSPPPSSGFTAVERAELEELRAANERLSRQLDDMRQERSKFMSEIQELKNQNAGLIEDHTRDVLSIKAKETQLVRARSDVEATEQVNERLRRELERLKRALSRAEGLGAASGMGSPGEPRQSWQSPLPHFLISWSAVTSPTHDDAGIFRDPGFAAANRNRMSFASTLSEEKENGEMMYPRSKLSPEMRHAGSTASSGRGSPARGFRGAPSRDDGSDSGTGMTRERPVSSLPQPSGGAPGESWRRAAEVTSQLKARIEQMKAKQGFPRP